MNKYNSYTHATMSTSFKELVSYPNNFNVQFVAKNCIANKPEGAHVRGGPRRIPQSLNRKHLDDTPLPPLQVPFDLRHDTHPFPPYRSLSIRDTSHPYPPYRSLSI